MTDLLNPGPPGLRPKGTLSMEKRGVARTREPSRGTAWDGHTYVQVADFRLECQCGEPLRPLRSVPARPDVPSIVLHCRRCRGIVAWQDASRAAASCANAVAAMAVAFVPPADLAAAQAQEPASAPSESRTQVVTVEPS